MQIKENKMAEITYNTNGPDGINRTFVTNDRELLVALSSLDKATLDSLLEQLNTGRIQDQTIQEEILGELKEITKQLKKVNC